jgi:hypothetical protein
MPVDGLASALIGAKFAVNLAVSGSVTGRPPVGVFRDLDLALRGTGGKGRGQNGEKGLEKTSACDDLFPFVIDVGFHGPGSPCTVKRGRAARAAGRRKKRLHATLICQATPRRLAPFEYIKKESIFKIFFA